MSWVAVARKDFRDSARSKVLWAVIVLFVLFAGGIAYLFVEVIPSTPAEQTAEFANAVTLFFVLLMSGNVFFGVGPVLALVPVIGLMLGYNAIVGERDGGQIKLLLSLPHSRADVVLGKFLGRSTVAVVGALVGFLIGGVIVGVFESLALVIFLQFVLAVAFFTVIHVSIGIGISSAAPSSTWSAGLVVAFVAVFQVLWGVFFLVLREVLNIGRSGTAPDWYRFLLSITPGRAYDGMLSTLIPQYAEFKAEIGAVTGAPPPGSRPFYLQDWFGIVILVLWLVVPLALGYLRFDSVDLA